MNKFKSPKTDAAQKFCGEKLTNGSPDQIYLTWYGYMSEECRHMENLYEETLEKLDKTRKILKNLLESLTNKSHG